MSTALPKPDDDDIPTSISRVEIALTRSLTSLVLDLPRQKPKRGQPIPDVHPELVAERGDAGGEGGETVRGAELEESGSVGSVRLDSKAG